MGKFLDQLFEDVKDSDFDTNMKKLSDRIMDEESKDIVNKEDLKGMLKRPNIFIALPCNTESNDSFLCLERENAEEYIITLWNKDKIGTMFRRVQTWPTKEVAGNQQKIIKMFGEKLRSLIKK